MMVKSRFDEDLKFGPVEKRIPVLLLRRQGYFGRGIVPTIRVGFAAMNFRP
jgi:hypothetical protein